MRKNRTGAGEVKLPTKGRRVVRNSAHNGNGQSKPELSPGTVPWKEHLSSYRDLRELRFQTTKQNHKALGLLDSEALRDMPYDLTGGGIVVPAEAVPYFKTAGKFTQKKLDLS
jgi:hypothetical protein